MKQLLAALSLSLAFAWFGAVSLAQSTGTLTISPSNITLQESDTPTNSVQSFEIQLSPVPTATVTLDWQTDFECEVAHHDSPFAIGGAVVTGGDKYQMKVQPRADESGESTHSCSVVYTLTSADSRFDGLTQSQSITILDDGDTFTSYRFNETAVTTQPIRENSNQLFSYQLAPSIAPTFPVEITATSSEQCVLVENNSTSREQIQTQAAGSVEPLTWQARARDDTAVEGDHSCIITYATITDDPNFAGVTINATEVPITDDESAPSTFQVDYDDANPELGLLDSRDSNNDGIADSEQPHVQPFTNPLINKRHALVIYDGDNTSTTPSVCTDASGVDIVSESDLLGDDESYSYPIGLYSFSVLCNEPGSTITVELLLDGTYAADGLQLRKYQGNGFSNITGATFENRPIGTNGAEVTVIRYSLTDGGNNDADGIANGEIIDPVGLGLFVGAPSEAVFSRINDANTGPSITLTVIITLLVTLLATVTVWLWLKYSPLHRHTKLEIHSFEEYENH